MAGIGLAALVSSPAAAASITFTVGGNTATIVDNGAGSSPFVADTNAATGLVDTNTGVSNFFGWQITTTGGASNSPSGVPSALDLSVDGKCVIATCNPLTVDFSDSGFTQSLGGFTETYNTSLVAGTGTSSQVATLNTTNFGSMGPFSGDSNTTITGSTPAGTIPYSLSLTQTFTGTNGTQFSTDGSLSIVPEPTSLFLMGSGLFGLASFGRRKLFKR